MPAKMALPPKAKMAALVCSGRKRPKVMNSLPKLNCQAASCSAATSPNRKAARPHTIVAITNAFTIVSS